jgi:hypothetical protein
MMGEAKRRRVVSNTSEPPPNRRGVSLLDIYIIRPSNGPDLFIAAAAGDERAACIINAVDTFLKGVGRQCLCCDRRFSVTDRPKAFVVGFSETGIMVLMGLCPEHHRDDDAELVQIALDGFRQLVPSTRAVPVCAVSTRGGHA